MFTLDPVEATVPAGERELRFEARIGNRLCVLPPADTHPDRSETRSLLVSRPAPPPQAQFIKPPIISLAQNQTKQLVALDQMCGDLSSFPSNLQIWPKTAAGTDGAATATVNSQTGVVTAGSTPGTVSLDVRKQPDQTILKSAKATCRSGDTPWVQVGPIYIYLRFDEAEAYLTGSLPRGLGLSATEASQVKMKAVERVQNLYNQVMANVIVTSEAPPGWTVEDGARDFDGIITMEIHFETESDGRPKPVREWGQQPTVVYGQAPVNELNWLAGVAGTFGLDALKVNNDGVFLNRLPLLRPQTSPPQPLISRRVTIDQIAVAIGNVAAHEAGHALGLVPNDRSDQLRNEWLDPRFGGVDFDGVKSTSQDPKPYHSSASNQDELMVARFREITTETPTVLTTTPKFRTGARKDGDYLRVILPRP
ncbi:MAG: hypothetical protein QXD59_02725 [Candidatus Caldarchaeum sp.]